MAVLEYDAIVDAGRRGNFLTIQAADDALDGGAYMIWVKSGTYAGFIVSTPNVLIFCEPGTVITSAIVLTGAGVCLVLSTGCDIQGSITLDGVGSSLICENGVDLVGCVVSGARSYITGGGWDTVMDGGITRQGMDLIDDDIIVENIAAQTTAGGGQSFHGVEVNGARNILSNVKIPDSDNHAIVLSGGGDQALVMGCVILGADDRGINHFGLSSRLIGNYFTALGSIGISLGSLSDDSVTIGNVVQDQTDQSVLIDAVGENNVVHENRLDGAVTDNSGTSTVAHNDTEAF